MAARAQQVSPERVDDVPVVSLLAPKRRKPSWMVAGVLMVAFAALLGAWAFTAATDTIQVVVAARDLDVGNELEVRDLRVVEMGRTRNLRAIQPAQQDLIVGRAARGPIPAGTVLNTGLFVDRDEVLPPGTVVVGVSLGAGELAAPSVVAGDSVRLIAVTRAGAGSQLAEEPEVLGEATVWSLTGEASTSASSERIWLSLLVAEQLQTAVAQAAADEVLRVVLTP